MSIELVGIILIGGLLLLLALGVEIAIAMGVMASLGFIFIIGKPQIQIPWTAWLTMNSFNLLAMSLFIFMGTMFANTGVVHPFLPGRINGLVVCLEDWHPPLSVPVLSLGLCLVPV